MTKRFFVDAPDKWEKAEAAIKLRGGEVKASVYPNATVLPLVPKTQDEIGAFVLDEMYKGGVCDASGNFVAGRIRKDENNPGNLSCCGSYDVSKEEVGFHDERAVFGGVLYRHFGHMLVDGFARLWYLVGHCDFDVVVFLECPFKFASDFDPFDFIRLLIPSGIRVEIVSTPTRFREVVVPDEAFYPFGEVSREFVLPFDAIASNLPKGEFKRVYLSRSRYQQTIEEGVEKTAVFNECWYESFFARRGFEIVHPEILPVERQISIIAGAEEIVSTVGTMTHMLLFASQDASVVILNRAGMVQAQLRIDKARGIAPIYVDAQSNPMPTHHARGPILLSPNRFFKAYLDAAGVEYDESEFDVSGDLPVLVYDFLREWARVYRDAHCAEFIGRYTMFDVIRHLNGSLYDDFFEEEAYRDANRLRESERQCAKLERENKKLIKQREKLERQIEGMKSSTSWQITRPLRAFGRRLHQKDER